MTSRRLFSSLLLAALIVAALPAASFARQLPDLDDDGIADAVDNCPRVWNPDQASADGGAGDACSQTYSVGPVTTRPANQGDKHQTWSGANITLRAVNTAFSANQFMWDFGDGSAPTAWTAIADPQNLGLNHVYTGPAGVDTDYVAVVSVRSSANPSVVRTAEYPVVVKDRTLDVDSAMAVEQGLWYLHTNMQRGTYAAGAPGYSSPYGNWPAPLWNTIAAARAFVAQGHKLTGANRLTDPYHDTITRAANYLMTVLISGAITNQVHAGASHVPDTNGNGYGLQVTGSGGSNGYYDGFMLDLLTHFGAPSWTAFTGDATKVKGRTLKEISQDFIDWLAFAQQDSGTGRGGWWYTANMGGADNSTSMYPATGLLAAKEMTPFGLTIPAFVPAENAFWTAFSQNPFAGAMNGSFGYMSNNDCSAFGAGWYFCTVDTSSGILQLTMQGVPASDSRIQKALAFLGNNWGYAMSANSVSGNAGMASYPMYAAFKALRHTQVTTLTRNNVSFDWYNSEALMGAAGSNTFLGLRRRLVSRQQANGMWSDTGGNAPFSGAPSTALSVIMLSEDDYIVNSTATANDVTINYNGLAHPGTGTCVNSAPGTIGSYKLNGVAINGEPTDAGTYTFVLSCPGDARHFASSDTGTITIAKAPTTVSVTFGVGPFIYTGAPFTATAGVSGGTVSEVLPVTYGNDCTNVVDISANPCSATASYAGDANHLASSGSRSIVIEKAESTVAIDCTIGAPFAYSGAAITPCVATPAGAGTVTGVATLTYSNNVNAGTATATATYPGDDNHYASPEASGTFAIAPKAASVTAGSGSKVFGTADPILTPSSSGFLAGDNIVVTQDARDAGENAGTYATHASAGGAGIANYAVQSIDGTLEITRAAVTVTATGAVFTYDGQAHEGICSAAGLNGDVFNADASYAPGVPVSAGPYTLTCSFAGNGNYAPASNTATITINKAAATVTAGSGSKIYGSADPVLTPGASGFLAGDAISVTQSARDAGENVGSYSTHAGASGAAIGNYAVAFVDGALAIAKAPLTVTANNVTRSFGAANPPLTATITGFVFGETSSVLGGTLSVITTATPASPLGVYPIVASGLTSANYNIAFVNGTLTINNSAPVCTAAAPSVTTLWEPNHVMVPITLRGVTDAENDALTYKVVAIFQDEPIDSGGSGHTIFDGAGIGTSTAQVRAERAGTGNGRVYHLTFTVTDTAGASCTTTVKVTVPHAQNGNPAVDGGALFNSTIPAPKK